MGWTMSFHANHYKTVKSGWRAISTVDRRKECDDLLTWDSMDNEGNVITRRRVLKSAMVGSTYYAAVEKIESDGNREVWAAIFLTCGKSNDGTKWGYKDMDETMLPFYYDCPAGILALLTPTDSANANKWREECRKTLAAKAEKRKNGEKLYVPAGVFAKVEGKSWIITSDEYKRNSQYSAVKFTKKRWHDFDTAMRVFLANYGTAAQKKEFAESGRGCPAEWRGQVA